MSEPRFPPEHLQVLAHFYRGELQRSVDWRTRLDITTNWAIIATTATFSWAFRNLETGPESHIIFLITSLTVFLLLGLEARRYRYYDLWHTRVRMLEVHLLVPSLNPEHRFLEGDWRSVLSNDLLQPTYKISFWEAIARRLRLNYIWIFLGLLAGWLLRVYTGADRGEDGELSASEFVDACGFGVITPLEMIIAYVAFWALLVTILITTWKTRRVTGEIRRRDPGAKSWPI